jgi:hypothetical protein
VTGRPILPTHGFDFCFGKGSVRQHLYILGEPVRTLSSQT